MVDSRMFRRQSGASLAFGPATFVGFVRFAPLFGSVVSFRQVPSFALKLRPRPKYAGINTCIEGPRNSRGMNTYDFARVEVPCNEHLQKIPWWGGPVSGCENGRQFAINTAQGGKRELGRRRRLMLAHGLRRCGLLMVLAVVLVGLGVGIKAVAQDKPDPKSEIGGLHSKFVDVNGVKARYYEAGAGEPMVMIHGGFTAGSSTANVFSRNIAGLAQHFHVFAVDRLASGMSGNPLKEDDYTYQGDVDFVYGFIQALHLGPVHLVGHSAGGAIALYLAIEHPEAAKTLTILAMGPENPSPAPDNKTRLDLSKCPDQSQYEGLQCRVAMLAWLPTTFDEEYWAADQFMAMLPKSKEARAKLNAGAGRSFDFPEFKQKMLDKVRDEGTLQ